MKKIIAIILCLLLVSCPALAATYTNLHDVQMYIYSHSGYDMGPFPPTASIMGTITSIDFVVGNHYEFTLEVDEDRALSPLGHEKPYCVFMFRLHGETMPFDVGDQALAVGEINSVYSSQIIPYFVLSSVNGYDQEEF